MLSLFQTLRAGTNRFISRRETLKNWFQNREKPFRITSLGALAETRKSDTIFVLGGSESINNISEEEWDIVGRHDSIALNWWPVHWFVPTYYYTNYPKDPVIFDKFVETISRGVQGYSETIFLISGNRARQMGIHPRVIPQLFCDNPNICFYKHKHSIVGQQKAAFSERDFTTGSLIYRGGLSVVFDIINDLGYKNIALLGIDLRDRAHFYDDYPSMSWAPQLKYRVQGEEAKKQRHETMKPKGSKLPIDQYIYAVTEMYFAPKGVRIFVGSPTSKLCDKLPLVDWKNWR